MVNVMDYGRGIYGGWWRPGLGQSGETETEGTGLPPLTIDTSSGEIDPSTVYLDPGFNIQTQPGVELTPVELSAEQARARAWLAQLPNLVTAGSKVALTTAQIAAGVAAGAVKPSSTCPSGYLLANGQCVETPTTIKGGPLGGDWLGLFGISNQTLLLVGAGFLFLMILSSSGGGGRRR